jgi:hypothetical protein
MFSSGSGPASGGFISASVDDGTSPETTTPCRATASQLRWTRIGRGTARGPAVPVTPEQIANEVDGEAAGLASFVAGLRRVASQLSTCRYGDYLGESRARATPDLPETVSRGPVTARSVILVAPTVAAALCLLHARIRADDGAERIDDLHEGRQPRRKLHSWSRDKDRS